MSDRGKDVRIDFNADTKGVRTASKNVEKLVKDSQRKNKAFKSANTRDLKKERSDELKYFKQLDKIQRRSLDYYKQYNSLRKEGLRLSKEERKLGTGGGPGGGSDSLGGRGGQGGRPFYSVTKKGMGQAFGMVGGAIAGALISAMVRPLMDHHEAYVSYARAAASLSGMGVTSGGLKGIRRQAAGLGFGAEDTIGQLYGLSRATGATGSTLAGGLNTAQLLSRGGFASVDELTGTAGTIRRAGSKKAFQDLLTAVSLGTQKGFEKTRTPEYLQSVSTLLETAQSTRSGAVDTTGIVGLLASLGKRGDSGFQGARGANLLQSIDAAIKNPGDEQKRAAILRSFGFGTPGGNRSFYEAEKMRQQGIFGIDDVSGNRATSRSVDVISQIIRQTISESGFGEAGFMHLGEMLGISLEQSERLMRMYQSGDLSTDAGRKAISSVGRSSLNMSDQILLELKDSILSVSTRAEEWRDAQIDMGEQTYQSMTDLQDVMRDFVKTTFPAVKAVLESLVEGVNYLREGIERLSGDYSTSSARRMADRAEALQSDASLTDEQKRRKRVQMAMASIGNEIEQRPNAISRWLNPEQEANRRASVLSQIDRTAGGALSSLYDLAAQIDPDMRNRNAYDRETGALRPELADAVRPGGDLSDLLKDTVVQYLAQNNYDIQAAAQAMREAAQQISRSGLAESARVVERRMDAAGQPFVGAARGIR